MKKHLEQELYNEAITFIKKRYPKGWGGVGVAYTNKGNFLKSVALESFNGSAGLCIETGVMIEATKLNEKITHCICVVRDDENSQFKVLSPCGICQERLRYWGEDVKVGVTTENLEPKFVTLKELQPYHWTAAYDAEELEHYEEEKFND